MFQQSIPVSRIGGHIPLIGVSTGFCGEVDTAMVMACQIRLQGLIVGSRCQQQEFARAIDAVGFESVIDSSFASDELSRAFRALKTFPSSLLNGPAAAGPAVLA